MRLNVDEFLANIERHLPQKEWPDKIGIALSGGPDSMALLHMLHHWCLQTKRKLVAFHVNHQLRPTADEEAHQVVQWCEAWQIHCQVLVWDHPHAQEGKHVTQKEAREARYSFLEEACHATGIDHLFLAHHADDQQETFVMRLFKGSGLTGLCGIQPLVQRRNISYCRPLLSFSKAQINDYIHAQKIPFLQDPSNENQDYNRVKVRTLLHQAKEMGLAPAKLLHTVEKLQLLQESFLEDFVHFLQAHGTLYALGYIRFDHQTFADLSFAKQCFFLESGLKIVSGRYYAPRWEALQNMVNHMQNASFSSRTIGGCYIQFDQGDVLLMRELDVIEEEQVINAEKICWDQRFFIEYNPRDTIYSKCRIKKLGQEGRLILKRAGLQSVLAHPAIVIATLPGIWQNEQLLAVPSLSHGMEECHVTFSPDALRRLPHKLKQQGVLYE